MRTRRVLVTVIVAGCLTLGALGVALAQQTTFSLATWQSTTVARYTLRYTGLRGGWPAYDLYSQGMMLATFPPNPLPATCCDYSYGGVSIVTTGIAADGTAVGVMTVR